MVINNKGKVSTHSLSLSLRCALKGEESKQNKEIPIILIQTLPYDLHYGAPNATALAVTLLGACSVNVLRVLALLKPRQHIA